MRDAIWKLIDAKDRDIHEAKFYLSDLHRFWDKYKIGDKEFEYTEAEREKLLAIEFTDGF